MGLWAIQELWNKIKGIILERVDGWAKIHSDKEKAKKEFMNLINKTDDRIFRSSFFRIIKKISSQML